MIAAQRENYSYVDEDFAAFQLQELTIDHAHRQPALTSICTDVKNKAQALFLSFIAYQRSCLLNY